MCGEEKNCLDSYPVDPCMPLKRFSGFHVLAATTEFSLKGKQAQLVVDKDNRSGVVLFTCCETRW